MKRSVLILSLAAFVLSSNAQVLKSNLLNGYKQGDKLEKATYNKADAPIKIDTWCEAFSSQTDKNAGSPITGQELSYLAYIPFLKRMTIAGELYTFHFWQTFPPSLPVA